MNAKDWHYFSKKTSNNKNIKDNQRENINNSNKQQTTKNKKENN
jgi:hypothetical protein